MRQLLRFLLTTGLQIQTRRAKRLWLAATSILLLQGLSEFALIYLLSLSLQRSQASDLPLCLIVLACRVGTGFASADVLSRLAATGRADLQFALWSATLAPDGAVKALEGASSHNRALNQAPTDSGVGLLGPSAAIAADGLTLAAVGLAAMIVNPLAAAVASASLALIGGFMGVFLLRAANRASTAEANALELAHHTSWDITHAVRDIHANRAAQFVLDRGLAVKKTLFSTTRTSQKWPLIQRGTLDGLSLTLLTLAALLGRSAATAFLIAALLLRLLPLIARIGGSSVTILAAGSRLRLWEEILKDCIPVAKEVTLHSGDGQSLRDRAESDRVLHVSLTGGKTGSRLKADISFDVAPSDWIVVRGASGVGKSSVLDAITGLWPDYQGEVLLGVQPTAVGYASQTPFLVQGTVIENVTLGRPTDESHLETVARVCGLPETFGGTWRTKWVLDRGMNLSGGQRQRVSLARSLSSHPELLLLDEATANLDSESEALILTHLRSVMPRLAVVLVTHRPVALPWHVREEFV